MRGGSVEATGLSALAAHSPIPSDSSCAPIFPRTDREPALRQKSWAGWRGKRQGEVICAATVRMGAACFLYVVVGEWEWNGIGPATPWKYPRVMPAGPKVAGFSTDSRFHVAMLDLRYHAVGKHGGHISGAAFPNHALGVGGEPSAVFLLCPIDRKSVV